MALNVCGRCGLKFTARPTGCPRCAAGGKGRKSSTSETRRTPRWVFLVMGVFLAFLAYRTFLGVETLVATGTFDLFWDAFFGRPP